MVTVALFVRLEAKPGKEPEVEKFLKGGLPIVEGEPATTAWFALRLGPSTFGIFDAFPNEGGREAGASLGACRGGAKNTAVVITDPQNPAPDFYDKDRPCKNIYTDAIVMLNVHTSKLAWYYQVIPHDVHDYDLTHVAPVFTTTVDGQQRTVIAHGKRRPAAAVGPRHAPGALRRPVHHA